MNVNIELSDKAVDDIIRDRKVIIMLKCVLDGYTLEQTGCLFNISGVRVKQLISKFLYKHAETIFFECGGQLGRGSGPCIDIFKARSRRNRILTETSLWFYYIFNDKFDYKRYLKNKRKRLEALKLIKNYKPITQSIEKDEDALSADTVPFETIQNIRYINITNRLW